MTVGTAELDEKIQDKIPQYRQARQSWTTEPKKDTSSLPRTKYPPNKNLGRMVYFTMELGRDYA